MNNYFHMSSVFGEDVNVENIELRINSLIENLDQIIYALDRDEYPSRYLEFSIRLRLGLSHVLNELIPQDTKELFRKDIEDEVLMQVSRIATVWNTFFTVKKIPFGATATIGAHSICLEVNLNANQKDIISEVVEQFNIARENARSNLHFDRHDNKERLIKFPINTAIKALEEYESSLGMTPTAAARDTIRVAEKERQDSIERTARRRVHEHFFKYIFWEIE